MFHLNIQNRQMSKLMPVSFFETGLKERQDLQEWIVSNPSCLGEELLIIQKEFNGFDNTTERLDLLAIDKQGNLVIIENKTDNSGRDVVWQAVKYASYCSRLTQEKVLQLFAQYLQKNANLDTDDNSIELATTQVYEFLANNEQDIELNLKETDIRIILVAVQFRPEVTSAVLWLMNFGINIKCIECQLFQLKTDLFFSTNQIIPIQSAESYMIDIAEKKQEEMQIKKHQNNVFFRFWGQLVNSQIEGVENIYQGRTPTKDNWFSISSGYSNVVIASVITKTSAKIRVEIREKTKAERLRLFSFLKENSMYYPLEKNEICKFLPCEDKVTSFIIIANEELGYENQNLWQPSIEYLLKNSLNMKRHLTPLLDKYYQN